jgi:hypothetical protein
VISAERSGSLSDLPGRGQAWSHKLLFLRPGGISHRFTTQNTCSGMLGAATKPVRTGGA